MANEEVKAQNLETVLKTTYNLLLQYGIENVTKEMISQKSGLSRRSIDRYFIDKKDCVIRVVEWFLLNLRHEIGRNYPATIFTDGKYTGAELLRKYMTDLKNVFFKEPRHFVLYTEFKLFIYRNCEEHEQAYTLLVNWMGTRNIRKNIYNLGKKDGSLPNYVDSHTEEEYFCESFFGFLSNLALSFKLHSEEETEKQIDQRIDNTIALYTGKIVLK